MKGSLAAMAGARSAQSARSASSSPSSRAGFPPTSCRSSSRARPWSTSSSPCGCTRRKSRPTRCSTSASCWLARRGARALLQAAVVTVEALQSFYNRDAAGRRYNPRSALYPPGVDIRNQAAKEALGMRGSRLMLMGAVFALLLLLSVVEAGAQTGGEWPQWRGANRDGISKETGLLKQWPEGGPPLVWKAAGAGRGYSSFAVSKGRLYTMGLQGRPRARHRLRRRHGQAGLGDAARRECFPQRPRRRPARHAHG